MEAWLPGSFHITVNGILSIAVIDSLPAPPWPPGPTDFDHCESAGDAARYMFATSTTTISVSVKIVAA